MVELITAAVLGAALVGGAPAAVRAAVSGDSGAETVQTCVSTLGTLRVVTQEQECVATERGQTLLAGMPKHQVVAEYLVFWDDTGIRKTVPVDEYVCLANPHAFPDGCPPDGHPWWENARLPGQVVFCPEGSTAVSGGLRNENAPYTLNASRPYLEHKTQRSGWLFDVSADPLEGYVVCW